jgi:hypothetical protein
MALADHYTSGGLAQGIRAAVGIEEPMDPAEELISKSAEDLPGPVVDPVATLTGALSKLTETFEQENGRRPSPDDDAFFEAVGKVYARWMAALERGGTR